MWTQARECANWGNTMSNAKDGRYKRLMTWHSLSTQHAMTFLAFKTEFIHWKSAGTTSYILFWISKHQLNAILLLCVCRSVVRSFLLSLLCLSLWEHTYFCQCFSSFKMSQSAYLTLFSHSIDQTNSLHMAINYSTLLAYASAMFSYLHLSST